MQFTATLRGAGKTATGIEVPDHVVEELGSKRAKVAVTVNGHTWRTSFGSMGGTVMLPVNAEVRAAAGIAAGDELTLDVVLDTAERTIEVPEDLAAALAPHAEARAFFDGLSYSQQRWFVEGITSAKKPETRTRRVEAAVERLREGRGQR